MCETTPVPPVPCRPLAVHCRQMHQLNYPAYVRRSVDSALTEQTCDVAAMSSLIRGHAPRPCTAWLHTLVHSSPACFSLPCSGEAVSPCPDSRPCAHSCHCFDLARIELCIETASLPQDTAEVTSAITVPAVAHCMANVEVLLLTFCCECALLRKPAPAARSSVGRSRLPPPAGVQGCTQSSARSPCQCLHRMVLCNFAEPDILC